MLSDNATFFLSFLSVFAGLAYYLWHLERRVNAALERMAPDTTAKNDDEVEPS